MKKKDSKIKHLLSSPTDSVTKLADHYAVCCQCGATNTAIPVVTYNSPPAAIRAGLCRRCLIDNGFLPDAEGLYDTKILPFTPSR